MEMNSRPLTLEQTPHYAKLVMGDRGLLLPQHEVLSLEPIQDLESAETDDNSQIGCITLKGQQVPIYCLSRDLIPIREIPEDHRLCVLLQDELGASFGILCHDVVTMESTKLRVIPLPECMRLPGTPIRALALDGEQIFCISSSSDLTAITTNSEQSQSDLSDCDTAGIIDSASAENMELL